MSLTIEYIVMDSAKWANHEQTLVDCQVKFNEIDEVSPFTAQENEPNEPHVEAVWQKVVVEGVAGSIPLFDDSVERQQVVDEIKELDPTYQHTVVAYGQEGFVSHSDLTGILNEKKEAASE
jgi:hypothetical protein